MIPSEVPGEGASSESHAVASSAVPEEVVEQHVTFALETKGLRPRRTTGGTEHVYIWTTEHHLAAAAEASAEISVSLQVPDAPRAATVGQHHEDGVASAATANAAAREINPTAALGLLIADLAARLFCLSIFWVLLIAAILLSNAALCTALIHRKGLSVEAALGITVGLDAALAAASLAFMARRLSTDIIQWGIQKLQPGKEKLERLKGTQRDGNPEGGRFKGLHLQALQKRVHGQAEWLLGKAREKIKGRAPEACSSSDARGACDDASMMMEEGHTDKRDAGDAAAVVHRAKGLSLSALVSEVQKLTSLMVKADAPADRKRGSPRIT